MVSAVEAVASLVLSSSAEGVSPSVAVSSAVPSVATSFVSCDGASDEVTSTSSVCPPALSSSATSANAIDGTLVPTMAMERTTERNPLIPRLPMFVPLILKVVDKYVHAVGHGVDSVLASTVECIQVAVVTHGDVNLP